MQQAMMQSTAPCAGALHTPRQASRPARRVLVCRAVAKAEQPKRSAVQYVQQLGCAALAAALVNGAAVGPALADDEFTLGGSNAADLYQRLRANAPSAPKAIAPSAPAASAPSPSFEAPKPDSFEAPALPEVKLPSFSLPKFEAPAPTPAPAPAPAPKEEPKPAAATSTPWWEKLDDLSTPAPPPAAKPAPAPAPAPAPKPAPVVKAEPKKAEPAKAEAKKEEPKRAGKRKGPLPLFLAELLVLGSFAGVFLAATKYEKEAAAALGVVGGAVESAYGKLEELSSKK